MPSRALAFDRGGLAPAAALRSALGVATPLVIGAAAGHPADGAMAAAGALPVGVAAMSGDQPAPPLALLLSTTVGMSLSTFVGSLCAGHVGAVLATLVAWGFFSGVLVALGRAATITGVQAVIGLIVFGRYPGGIATSGLHAAAVLSGGLIQTLFALLLRPPVALRPERQALADLYQRLAALAAGAAYGGPSGEAIASTSSFLARRAPEVTTLRDLVDEAARVRLELQALQSVPDVTGVEEVTGAAAGRLRRIARGIDRGSLLDPEPPDLADAVDALRRAAPAPARATARQRFAAARAAALLGQVRAIDRHTDALAGRRHLPLPRIAGTVAALELTGVVAGAFGRLRQAMSDPSTSAFRHGVRLAVLLPVADLISRALPWQRGYWVPLTALVVLKPDYAATVQRGLARIVGTGLGIVVAGVIVATAHPKGGGLVLAVSLAAWASYTLFASSYALYTFALTSLVVLLISTGDPRPLSAVADRGLDTLLGGAIALLGYLAWPTREATTLRTTTARLLSSLADYADVVLAGYVAGRYDPTADRSIAAERARAARRARADAQASLDRALAEPARLRPETEVALSVLAGARRVVITLHALRSTLQDTNEHVALPELTSLRNDVATALRELSAAAADERAPQLPALREAQGDIERLADAEPQTLRGRRLALTAAHLDPLVDAIDTVGHVLSEHSLSEEPAAAGLVGGG
ncbi:MAG TPA: FUSC family protein [Mycobacteriales bacterium]|nr:FUSC family protein [Mycobacteriales bacterium]